MGGGGGGVTRAISPRHAASRLSGHTANLAAVTAAPRLDGAQKVAESDALAR